MFKKYDMMNNTYGTIKKVRLYEIFHKMSYLKINNSNWRQNKSVQHGGRDVKWHSKCKQSNSTLLSVLLWF